VPTTQPFRIQSQPGIKRDGTLFEGSEYKDGLWCRFNRRGLPRKMGGYRAVTSNLPEVVRGVDSYFSGGTNYTHLGSQSFVTQVQSDMFGNPGSQSDRTPTSGFIPNVNNLWSFDQFYDTVSGQTTIIGNPGQNLTDITNAVETPIFYGPAAMTTPLVATGMPNVSGGVVSIAPYLIGYSNFGRIDVSPINNITPGITFNSAFISDQKVVKGLPLRNGSGGPAAIFWTLADLVVMTYNPSLLQGIPFNFNTISAETSVLSAQAIVEFDGLYYWPEVDHFSVFNGVVRELPNTYNVEWFFKNLNFQYREKVFAVKVQSFGEIWWCAPLFGATECNWALIFNTYLNVWYDTPLPDSVGGVGGGSRSAGTAPRVFNKPYFTDVTATTTGFTLWQHETGTDKAIGGSSLPVRSYFKTAEFSPVTQTPAKDKAYRVALVEADFTPIGASATNLSVTVFSRANAREPQVASTPVNIPAVIATADQELTTLKQNARLLAFQFESNVPGGDYTLGHTLAHLEETDGRYTQ
jgi:hypothetical protein